jgi:hypothetical protein
MRSAVLNLDRGILRLLKAKGSFHFFVAATDCVLIAANALFPASGPVTGSFNGLHWESKFLAIKRFWKLVSFSVAFHEYPALCNWFIVCCCVLAGGDLHR